MYAKSCIMMTVWMNFCLAASTAFASGIDANDLTSLLEPVRKQYDLPALAAAVIADGQLKAIGATGVRKYGDTTPVTVDDQFHLGSCTKAMTATTIGMLIEQGKLKWLTTLAEAFPDMVESMHPAYRNVTLVHLLSHRAGLPPREQTYPKGMTRTDMHKLPGSPMQQRLEYTRLILSQPPIAKPGDEYIYSNAGYAIAGVIAEQAMDKPWETLMQEMLFKPLDMKTAGFGVMGSAGKIDQPRQHKIIKEKLTPIEPGPFSGSPVATGPGGAVYCSVGDWACFIAAHLKGENQDTVLLKKETMRQLHAPKFNGSYAFGWHVQKQEWGGGRVLSHSGSNGRNYAIVWMAPKRDFAVMVLSNQYGGEVVKACKETAGLLINQYLLDQN